MTHARTQLAVRLLIPGAVALLAGCAGKAADGDGPDEHPGTATDAGGAMGGDRGVGAADAGASSDEGGFRADAAAPTAFGGLPASPEAGAPTADYGSDETDLDDAEQTGARSCYDGQDNDGDKRRDCNDDSCYGLGSCCIGHGNCCSPAGSRTLALEGCEGRVWESCTDAFTPFGDPLPWVEDGLLAPGGDEEFHSGLVETGWHDLRSHRLSVRAELHPAEDCGASCIDSVGIGLTTQERFDDTTHVRPRVALVLADARNEVRLTVGDRTVAGWPAGDEAQQWSLVARPDGRVQVYREGTELTSETKPPRFVPPRRVRLAVYGRTRNSLGGDGPRGARAANIQLDESLCDMPAYWPERDELTIGGAGAGFDAEGLHAPSAAHHGGRTYLAFEQAGALWVAEQRSDVPDEFQLVSNSPARSAEGARLADPELLRNPSTGQWVLFYTRIEGTDRAIWRARTASLPDGFAGAEEIVHARGRYSSFDGPTVVRHRGATGVTWILVARGWRTGGHELVGFHSSDGSSWRLIGTGELSQITSSDARSGPGAMADAIADPTLVVHDNAWQLYYARREGARWSVGLLASHELLWWRSFGEVFGPASQSFDRVGTRGPAVTARDARVRLYYAGHDGVDWKLGRASRPAGTGMFGE